MMSKRSRRLRRRRVVQIVMDDGERELYKNIIKSREQRCEYERRIAEITRIDYTLTALVVGVIAGVGLMVLFS